MQQGRLMDFLGVAEAAAIASAAYNGRGDKVAADQAATTAMRNAFNELDFSGRIVIGEGERDEAPMLYIGEELGKGGEEIDIAVDPLEGTNLCAYNQPNSICTIAVAPRGALLYAPDTYMQKIATGPAGRGVVHIDKSVKENVEALAAALNKPVEELTVMVLDRDRHQDLIAQLRETGCRVRLIYDGDVYGCISTAVRSTGIDMYMGSGGAPEGVLAATALKSIGGFFQGRFNFRSDEERARAEKTAEVDLDGVLTMDDLVRSDDAAFIAVGVTDGEMLGGVRKSHGKITTFGIIMNASDRSVRYTKTERPLA